MPRIFGSASCRIDAAFSNDALYSFVAPAAFLIASFVASIMAAVGRVASVISPILVASPSNAIVPVVNTCKSTSGFPSNSASVLYLRASSSITCPYDCNPVVATAISCELPLREASMKLSNCFLYSSTTRPRLSPMLESSLFPSLRNMRLTCSVSVMPASAADVLGATDDI